MRGILLVVFGCALVALADEKGKVVGGEAPPGIGSLKVIQGPAGAKADWTALKGKVVVVHFWATWCPDCNADMEHHNKLVDAFKDKPVVFLSVTDEEEKDVAAYL